MRGPKDRAPHSPKTNEECLVEDDLGHYCPKTLEMAKEKKEKRCHWESNPGSMASTASALPLS